MSRKTETRGERKLPFVSETMDAFVTDAFATDAFAMDALETEAGEAGEAGEALLGSRVSLDKNRPVVIE